VKRRIRRRVAIVCVSLLAASCRSRSLTAAQAAELLRQSPLLAGQETITFSLPRGCFTIPAGRTLRAGDLERDRRLSESPALRQELQRSRDLDLLDFDFSPVPATIPAPPEGCEELWSSYRYGPKADEATRVKLVAWRTMMSDKALAAGLSPGFTFVYRKQTLVAITGTSSQDGDTVLVEYTWQWAPPLDVQQLGARPSAEMPAKAVLKRTAEGWRVAH
jgi:hypothetical protein